MVFKFPEYANEELLSYNQSSCIVVQRARSIQDPNTTVIFKGVTKYDLYENTKLQCEYDILSAIHTKLKLYVELSDDKPNASMTSNYSVTYEDRLLQSLVEGEPITNPSAHIAKPIRIVKSNDNVVMIMNDFAGKSLREYMAAEPVLNFEEFLNIALQIAESLDIIHCMGVIHRNINPDNIIVKYSDGKLQLQVVDFSLARYNRPGQENSDSFKGTLAYMSPGIY
jgi:serine/threonine protein kinase